MNVALRDMQWAIVAAQHRSLRQAAIALQVRQSTLSRSLRDLEHQMGATLFERTNGGTYLTLEGQEFLQAAKRIVEETEELAARFRDRSRGETGRLAVGVHVSLSAGNLRATLIELTRLLPALEIHLADGSRAHLISSLPGAVIDIAFVVQGNSQWNGNSLSLWSERVVVALPADHPLSGHSAVHWHDLKNELVLLPLRGPGPELLKLLVEKIGQPDGRYLRHHDVALDRLLTLVGAGFGILLALEGAAGASYPQVVFREVHDDHGPTRLGFQAIWRQENNNPSLHRFLAILDGAAIRKGRDVLAEIEVMEVERRPTERPVVDDNTYNKALLLLALQDAETAFSLLSRLPSHDRSDRVAAYGAVALKRLGRSAEAFAAINDALAQFNDTIILQLARDYLGDREVRASAALLTVGDDVIVDLKVALSDFQNLSPVSQAKVLVRGNDPLERLIVADVRAVAAEVTGMVPGYSRLAKSGLREDDASALFGALLRQRYAKMLRWSVYDQPPGGFSETGGIGKRDIVIKQDSLTVAVIENVVCRYPINWQKSQDDLEKHFRKLLGYSTCKIFLHLTFAYVTEMNAILVHLLAVLRRPPNGFTYREHKEIESLDSGPAGFIARYDSNNGPLTVCFLVLDMGQEIQRGAAGGPQIVASK